jgi:hypothetical protein
MRGRNFEMAKKIEEEFAFNDARYAMDVKKTAEEDLAKCKSGLKWVLIAQAAFIGAIVINSSGIINYPNENAALIGIGVCFTVALILSIVAFHKCGGINKVWGSVSNVIKKIAKLGWLILPFPIDIVTGLTFMLVGYIYVPIFLILFPILTYWINKAHLKKQIKEADKYLKYCDPVTTVEA